MVYMNTTKTIVELKSSLNGNIKAVPLFACGEVLEVRENQTLVRFPSGEFLVDSDQISPAPDHRCSPENAAKIKEWIETRGGAALWNSANLSNPGQTWTCPLNNAAGEPATKPSWEAGSIYRIISDPNEVIVETAKEVKRFHIALNQSSGTAVKLSKGSSDKVRKEVSKAGEKAWYAFDYFSQEAVIYVPETEVLLSEWSHP